MGMFDDIICSYPLPTESPFAAYQSKSLGCEMALYEITSDGRLVQTHGTFGTLDKPEDVPFTGVLEFYNANSCASAFGHLFTRNGEDFESVTYEAAFVSGKVTQIIETARERTPSLSSAFYRQADKVIDQDQPQIDTTEPEVGAELWRLWGGHDSTSYPVTLLAKTEIEWALRDDKGRIEKEYPSQLGNILFRTKEDAETAKWWRKEGWERKTQWCADRLAERLRGETVNVTERDAETQTIG